MRDGSRVVAFADGVIDGPYGDRLCRRAIEGEHNGIEESRAVDADLGFSVKGGDGDIHDPSRGRGQCHIISIGETSFDNIGRTARLGHHHGQQPSFFQRLQLESPGPGASGPSARVAFVKRSARLRPATKQLLPKHYVISSKLTSGRGVRIRLEDSWAIAVGRKRSGRPTRSSRRAARARTPLVAPEHLQ